jgi:hypothetical protein
MSVHAGKFEPKNRYEFDSVEEKLIPALPQVPHILFNGSVVAIEDVENMHRKNIKNKIIGFTRNIEVDLIIMFVLCIIIAGIVSNYFFGMSLKNKKYQSYPSRKI